MIPTIRIVSDQTELAWQAAERIVKSAEDAVIATGRFTLALSGGSTPQGLFKLLATDFANKIPWDKTHIFFADERCVPANHPDSNFGSACRLLLDHVNIPYPNLHRMAGEKDPAVAAEEYHNLLKSDFDRGLDLVLLGIGDDGHTASLFPGTAALGIKDRYCVANHIPALSSWRLTLTAAYINLSFEVLVLVAGKNKAAVIQDALEGLPGRYPIQFIQPASGRLVWMMDFYAAGMDSDEFSND